MATCLAFGTGLTALAEEPAPTPPLPAAAPPATIPPPTPLIPRDAPLEERLRKMEELYNKRFESMAKQNEALVKTVQDLSKKLEEATQAQRPQSRTRADGGRAGTDSEPPITGGLTSPPSPAERASKTGRDRLPLRAYYDQNYRRRYGYVLQSENEEFEIRFNGEVQVDSRIYAQQHQNPVINDLDVPRARLYFSGRVTKPIEYQLSFQRTNNSFDFLNAYLNFDYDDRLQLRFGRFRAPFTYEWAKLSNWEFLTPERAPFPANFGPNRQVGLMGWGNVLKNRLEYAVGIFDGPRNSYQDTNDAKDVMAFLDFRPFFQTETVLKTLSVGGSVDQGKENNPLVPALLRGSANASGNTLALATVTGDALIAVPFLAFNNNVRERGDRKLWELHATYFYKGLSVLGAWDSGINSYALTTPNARPVPLPVSGFHVQVGYILTGETLEKRALVEPLHPFDLRKGKFGLGALELQARYSELEVGRQVFTAGLADPNLWTNRADFVDAGFNWYLNKNVKFYFDWQHAIFAQPVFFHPGSGLQKTSDLYWLRLQLYY